MPGCDIDVMIGDGCEEELEVVVELLAERRVFAVVVVVGLKLEQGTAKVRRDGGGMVLDMDIYGD